MGGGASKPSQEKAEKVAQSLTEEVESLKKKLADEKSKADKQKEEFEKESGKKLTQCREELGKEKDELRKKLDELKSRREDELAGLKSQISELRKADAEQRDEIKSLKGKSAPPERLSVLLRSFKAISSELGLDRHSLKVVSETCRLLDSDRATLFLVNPLEQDLYLKVAYDTQLPPDKQLTPPKISLKIGAGIVGEAAQTRRTINVEDAQNHPKFNKATDKSTGYHTRNLITVPVTENSGEVIGVLQAINKNNGSFTLEDGEVLESFATQAGVMLSNVQLYQKSVKAQDKAMATLDLVKALHSDLGIHSVLFTLTNRTHVLLDADRCSVFLADWVHNELVLMQGAVEIRIPISAGIAGHVATTGESVNIPEAYEDKRFNQAVDKKSGYRTRTILCMPIFNSKNDKVIGVMQVINKESGVFDADDEDMLKFFLGIAGSILESSSLFNAVKKENLSEMDKMMGKGVLTRTKSDVDASAKKHEAMIIEEGDEEED